MELGLFAGGQDGEHISVGFMEISIIIFSTAGYSSVWLIPIVDLGKFHFI